MNRLSTKLIQPIFKSGRFANPFPTYEGQKLMQHLQWMWGRKHTKAPLPKMQDLHEALLLPPSSSTKDTIKYTPYENSAAIQTTWIGQSTMLVQMGGLNILTDPMFSEICSPVSFIGPKRLITAPFTPADLPRIDAVIISHDHYDHLDLPSVVALGNTPKWFVPLGMGKWLASLGITNVSELGWWKAETYKGVEFIATPAQHWSGRSPMDQWRSLWCGWAVHAPKSRFYFCGDSGYCSAFQQIGAELGPFDLAALPIGGYEPEWFMRGHHMSPREAVQTHIDVRAKKSIAMHWGTFVFTDEHVLAPPKDLLQAVASRGITNFAVSKLGQSFIALPDMDFIFNDLNSIISTDVYTPSTATPVTPIIPVIPVVTPAVAL